MSAKRPLRHKLDRSATNWMQQSNDRPPAWQETNQKCITITNREALIAD
jgi:hypothetical protein